MLDSTSPQRLHTLQDASLILLSLLLLPLSSSLLVLSYALRPLLSTQNATSKRLRCTPSFRPRTVLITGVGMTKGLSLARAFHLAGHNVIGADFSSHGIPVCGRFSVALLKFYKLTAPTEDEGAAFYIHDLLRIIHREKVDLWVSCSGVASAVSDGQAQEVITRCSDCVCIQFSAATTQMLHEKHSFIQATRSLGLPVPETHNVTSRDAVHKVLDQSPRTKKKYIMKSIGMDDATRGDMTLLPKRSMSETYNHISRIPISDSKPWVLQQYIRGKEYCTHALVIHNRVVAFVACPSLELLMHYEALSPDSALSRAMLLFTQEFVRRSRGEDMTGHLSFDFLIDERVSESGAEMVLLPIECNPRAHTAVCLFDGTSSGDMVEAYLGALEPGPLSNGHSNHAEEEEEEVLFTPNTQTKPTLGKTITPTSPKKLYWSAHDLVTLLVIPLLHLFYRRITLATFLRNSLTFLHHVLFRKDGTYELWDPLPWWWLYHVYWPGQFTACVLYGKRWSRVNVSTGKMFGC